jgi:hypothetical protein
MPGSETLLQRTVQVVTRELGVFMGSLVARQSITFNGNNTLIDSYDSTDPVPDGTRLPCYKLQTGELWDRVDSQFPGNVGGVTSQNVIGELSRSSLEGAFIVEMTDMARTGSPLAGEDAAQDQFKFMQLMLTATGQVRPSGGEDGVCAPAFAAASGLSNVRAQITFGPVF